MAYLVYISITVAYSGEHTAANMDSLTFDDDVNGGLAQRRSITRESRVVDTMGQLYMPTYSFRRDIC